MKMVRVWDEDTKIFLEEGNKEHGSNLEVYLPYLRRVPSDIIWDEKNSDGQSWSREYERNVKDKVWIECHKVGDSYDRYYMIKFAHKDVLERGFTEEELKFLNAYLGRFFLLKILDGKIRDDNDMSNIFIWDNETKTKYPIQYIISGSLKDFKAELKRFNLI